MGRHNLTTAQQLNSEIGRRPKTALSLAQDFEVLEGFASCPAWTSDRLIACDGVFACAHQRFPDHIGFQGTAWITPGEIPTFLASAWLAVPTRRHGVKSFD